MPQNRPPHISLRTLTADDQSLLWDALYVALWDPPHQPRRPRDVLSHPQIAAYVQDWGRDATDLGFVATDVQGTTLGVVWSRLLQPPLAGGAFLDERTPQLGIAVFDGARGRGVGGALLATHLTAASQRFPALSLGVHPDNVAALALYRRAGFTPFATGGGGYLNMVRAF